MKKAPRVLLVEASGRGFLNHYSHALGMGLQQSGVAVRLLTGVRDELAGWAQPFEKRACIQRGRKGWNCVYQQALQFEADIVHLQWVDNPFSVLRLVRKLQRQGIKVVYTPHNLLPHEKRWMLMPLYRLLYRALDKVVARDQHIAWALEELLDVQAHQVEFIPGSPNLLALHATQCEENDALCPARQSQEKRWLFFGHGSPRKGLDQLLDAIEMADWSPQHHLLLAGEGVMSSSYAERIRQLSQRIKITLINQYIPAEKVAQLFSSADMLLLPYSRQCKSPLLDLAAALKLPVLRSDRVEGADFSERRHGVTFEHNESTQLLELLQQDSWVAECRDFLQSQVSSEEMMSKLALRHLSLYQTLLMGHSAACAFELQQQSSGLGI